MRRKLLRASDHEATQQRPEAPGWITGKFAQRHVPTSTLQTDKRIAYAFLRFVFGVNICFHGLSRLLGDHVAFLAYLTQSIFLPDTQKDLQCSDTCESSFRA